MRPSLGCWLRIRGAGRAGEMVGWISCFHSALLTWETRRPGWNKLGTFRNQGTDSHRDSKLLWKMRVCLILARKAGVHDWKWFPELLLLPPGHIQQETFELYPPDPAGGHLQTIPIQPKSFCISLPEGILQLWALGPHLVAGGCIGKLVALGTCFQGRMQLVDEHPSVPALWCDDPEACSAALCQQVSGLTEPQMTHQEPFAGLPPFPISLSHSLPGLPGITSKKSYLGSHLCFKVYFCGETSIFYQPFLIHRSVTTLFTQPFGEMVWLLFSGGTLGSSPLYAFTVLRIFPSGVFTDKERKETMVSAVLVLTQKGLRTPIF